MRLLAGLALLALNVGCATMGGSLLNASDALEERSGQFYDQVRQDSNGGGPSIEAAEALASAAIDFRRAAERDSPREDLAAAFDRVSGPYHELRQYFDQGYATSSERDRFQGISNAYLDVAGALKFRHNEFSSEMKVR
jgi:hypothetical protein